MFKVYLHDPFVSKKTRQTTRMRRLLAVHESLDVESQRWAHAHDILSVEFLQYGRFPRIIQTAVSAASGK